MRDWLIALRGSRSQESIAIACGISQNHLSAIENGSRTPSVKTAKRIASVLGFPWTDFFKDQK